MHEVKKPDTTAAATDVSEFITDLDGGQFDRLLSIALSKTAAATVNHAKKGKVSMELTFEQIKGTHQVRVSHVIKFAHPTLSGKASEEATGATVLHVGRYGALSLAQPSLLDQDNQQRFPN
jgi:hypothetical protein